MVSTRATKLARSCRRRVNNDPPYGCATWLPPQFGLCSILLKRPSPTHWLRPVVSALIDLAGSWSWQCGDDENRSGLTLAVGQPGRRNTARRNGKVAAALQQESSASDLPTPLRCLGTMRSASAIGEPWAAMVPVRIVRTFDAPKHVNNSFSAASTRLIPILFSGSHR